MARDTLVGFPSKPALAWGSVLLLLIPGCLSRAPAVEAPEDVATSLRNFCQLYNAFVGERDKDPASAAQLQRWAEQLSKEKLNKLGVENVSQAFVSPRDHQPYELAPMKKGMMRVLLTFEKTGADGQHYGIDTYGRVHEYNDEYINGLLKANVPIAPPKR